MSTDLVTRMREVAEQIGTLPSTGMIEAERVMGILGEAVQIIGVLANQGTDGLVLAQSMTNSCEILYARNQELQRANNELVWQVIGAHGVEGNA